MAMQLQEVSARLYAQPFVYKYSVCLGVLTVLEDVICSQLSTLAVIAYNDSRPTQQPSDD